MTYKKDKRKGSENRQKTGDRERNVAHPNGEEHSRVSKGSGIKRIEAMAILALSSIVIIALVADDAVGIVADDVALVPTAAIWWDSLTKIFA